MRPHPKSLSQGERDFEFHLPSPPGRRVGDEGGSVPVRMIEYRTVETAAENHPMG
jgi:hypothetical protein